ncbi:MAG: phenylalanine--tRNA ligase subunit beta [Alcanivorax sp.]|nr:phenylalanine--tRNA ligase subunit beta [Alcanivorax sp.]MBI55195.1 phenylalanine--tRNA ligase subunit beta [Alcanivorax sp.]|tara:strand:- start:51648 stop:54023 length:2376 start_codon:yes stop_codon:yes gene_type:complete
MRFNEAWLREWVNPDIDTDTLVHQLTMAGLEVDAVEPAAAPFTGVVVGEIVSCQPHPDADKLRLCQVSDGDATFPVVCGAPNAREGLKAPFAKVGAQLPGDLKIKKAKLRGQPSEGMLCGGSELGLEDLIDGLLELPADAPVGADIRAWLNLDDTVIEVDLTPNRADCLSLRGVAREVGVLNRAPVTEPAGEPLAAAVDATFPVTVEDTEGCPRYLGRVIRGIDPAAATPLWMVERLRRAGLRSIDPIVDVTNYVLLELGQPLHAFDLNKLDGGIVVRKARAGEQLRTLDDQTLELRDDTLVIADGGGPVALAGIMGGRPTAVAEGTTDLFLECAFFNPLTIVGKARGYGLHTDSSHRYERGVDPALQQRAMERASALIVAIAGGEAGPVTEQGDAARIPAPAAITLRADKVTALLGAALADADIEDILTRLGMDVTADGDGRWSVTPPSWRFDMAIEEDLIEELARVHGYENLPSRVPAGTPAGEPEGEHLLPVRRLADTLRDRGYLEAITYSFVAPDLLAKVDPEHPPLALMNPISADLGVMRTSLFAGLLNAAGRNLNRQIDRLRLFETGLRFVPGDDGLNQEPMIAGLLYGSAEPAHWQAKARQVDFYDLKGDVEALVALSDATAFQVRPGQHPALHPGQCAELVRDGAVVGYLGKLHPRLAKDLDLPKDLYLFELALAPLRDGLLPRFQPVSDQPRVQRDLAFVMDDQVAAGDLIAAVRAACDERLRDVRLFDVYQGEHIEPGRKSLALTLTFQDPSRTLRDAQVNDLVEQVVIQLKQQFNATLRD